MNSLRKVIETRNVRHRNEGHCTADPMSLTLRGSRGSQSAKSLLSRSVAGSLHVRNFLWKIHISISRSATSSAPWRHASTAEREDSAIRSA